MRGDVTMNCHQRRMRSVACVSLLFAFVFCYLASSSMAADVTVLYVGDSQCMLANGYKEDLTTAVGNALKLKNAKVPSVQIIYDCLSMRRLMTCALEPGWQPFIPPSWIYPNDGPATQCTTGEKVILDACPIANGGKVVVISDLGLNDLKNWHWQAGTRFQAYVDEIRGYLDVIRSKCGPRTPVVYFTPFDLDTSKPLKGAMYTDMITAPLDAPTPRSQWLRAVAKHVIEGYQSTKGLGAQLSGMSTNQTHYFVSSVYSVPSESWDGMHYHYPSATFTTLINNLAPAVAAAIATTWTDVSSSSSSASPTWISNEPNAGCNDTLLSTDSIQSFNATAACLAREAPQLIKVASVAFAPFCLFNLLLLALFGPLPPRNEAGKKVRTREESATEMADLSSTHEWSQDQAPAKTKTITVEVEVTAMNTEEAKSPSNALAVNAPFYRDVTPDRDALVPRNAAPTALESLWTCVRFDIQLSSIEGIRVVAIAHIFIFHVYTTYVRMNTTSILPMFQCSFCGFGKYWVACFFLISGYVTAYSHITKGEKTSTAAGSLPAKRPAKGAAAGPAPSSNPAAAQEKEEEGEEGKGNGKADSTEGQVRGGDTDCCGCGRGVELCEWVSAMRQALSYVVEKLAPLYPLYFVAFALAFVAQAVFGGGEFAEFYTNAMSLLLLQSWFPPFHNELNGPAWFLSALAFCWLFTGFWLGRLYVPVAEKRCEAEGGVRYRNRIPVENLLVLLAYLYACSFMPTLICYVFWDVPLYKRWYGNHIHNFMEFHPLTNWYSYALGMTLACILRHHVVVRAIKHTVVRSIAADRLAPLYTAYVRDTRTSEITTAAPSHSDKHAESGDAGEGTAGLGNTMNMTFQDINERLGSFGATDGTLAGEGADVKPRSDGADTTCTHDTCATLLSVIAKYGATASCVIMFCFFAMATSPGFQMGTYNLLFDKGPFSLPFFCLLIISGTVNNVTSRALTTMNAVMKDSFKGQGEEKFHVRPVSGEDDVGCLSLCLRRCTSSVFGSVCYGMIDKSESDHREVNKAKGGGDTKKGAKGETEGQLIMSEKHQDVLVVPVLDKISVMAYLSWPLYILHLAVFPFFFRLPFLQENIMAMTFFTVALYLLVAHLAYTYISSNTHFKKFPLSLLACFCKLPRCWCPRPTQTPLLRVMYVEAGGYHKRSNLFANLNMATHIHRHA